jgi:hemoglobin
MDRTYDGNPMRVHVANTDVMPGMFGPWLDLFGATAEEVLSEAKAAHIKALAKRIGEALRYGVTQRGQERGAPPILR